MRVLVIDDEPKARQSIITLAQSLFDDMEWVGEAGGVESGVRMIRETNPELLFLDVQMQDGTGFDLLSRIDRTKQHVIFVTAYNHFALQALKFSAVDYLVKPVETQELQQALKKVREQKSLNEVRQKLDMLLQNRYRIDKIALPSVYGIEFVSINDIIHCEADDNYTFFYLQNGEKILVSKTLKYFEDLFTAKNFFRIHKASLVNLLYLKKFIKGDGGTVVLDDGTELPVSRRRKEGLMEVLREM